MPALDEPTPMAVDVPRTQLAPPLTTEEEEAQLSRRQFYDEKHIKKLLKRWQSYLSTLYSQQSDADTSTSPSPFLPAPSKDASLDELRQLVQSDLAQFSLLIQRNVLACEAEKLQVEEYKQNSTKLAQQHEETREAIARLKIELREAEQQRERKKEYDVIALRVNTLPPREDLERSITDLNDEIQQIEASRASLLSIFDAKRTMMEDIRRRIQEMILHGKDTDDVEPSSTLLTPAVSVPTSPTIPSSSLPAVGIAATRSTTPLNPDARVFQPSSLRVASMPASLSSAVGTTSLNVLSKASSEVEDGEDVEMGEVQQSTSFAEPSANVNGSSINGSLGKKNKTAKEDLEEGEASDASSELSDPPES